MHALRLQAALAGVDAESLDFVLSDLPEQFTPRELGLALDRLAPPGM